MPDISALVVQDYLILALCVLVGGALGSFFNVVVYRLPRGRSIVSPPSSCPKCGGRIRARHNIPVLGWLLLRGKCLDCGAAISSRYPLVEAITAITIGALAWLEPYSMGAHLPPPPSGMSLMLPQYTDLWWLVGLHGALLSGLLMAALIDYDGFRVPRGLTFLLLAFAIVSICLRPSLLPVPAFRALMERAESIPWLVSGVSSLYGAVVGAVFGTVVSPATGVGRSGDAGRWNGIIILAWIGATLGMQAVATIAAVCALLYQFAMMYRFGLKSLQHVTYPWLVWIATGVWIVCWRPIAGNSLFPLDARADGKVFAWQASIAIICAAVTYWFRGPQHLATHATPNES